MKNKIIASRYAQALFEVAQRNNEVERILKEIQFLSKYWQDDEKIRTFLINPDLSKEEKKKFIERFLASRFTKIFLNFLFILIEKNRLGYLPDIAEMYENLSYGSKGIEEVKVILAHPISQPSLISLENRIKKIINKQIKLELEINPEILGGVTVHFKDQIIDGSIRHNLKQLKEELSAVKFY